MRIEGRGTVQPYWGAIEKASGIMRSRQALSIAACRHDRWHLSYRQIRQMRHNRFHKLSHKLRRSPGCQQRWQVFWRSKKAVSQVSHLQEFATAADRAE